MASRIMKRRILDFISKYSDVNSVTPSYREIGAAVGLKSPASVSRYISQLKDEGKLVTANQKGQTIALARKITLNEELHCPLRVRLEVSDGGVIFFDCCMRKEGKEPASVSFVGIFDASQMKGRVGQVVGCRIEDFG